MLEDLASPNVLIPSGISIVTIVSGAFLAGRVKEKIDSVEETIKKLHDSHDKISHEIPIILRQVKTIEETLERMLTTTEKLNEIVIDLRIKAATSGKDPK